MNFHGVEPPGMQHIVLCLSEIPQWGSWRDNLHQLSTNSNVVGQSPHESAGVYLNQVSLTGQQHYSSHSARRNDRNGDRASDDPPGNGRHYHHSSGGGHGGPHGTPGGGDGGPPDDPCGGSSYIVSSCEFGRWCKHEQCT